MTDMKLLGTNLRSLRNANKWTQECTVKRINQQLGQDDITLPVLRYLEGGRRATMPINWLVGFAKLYHVTTDALLSRFCPGGHGLRPLPQYLTCRVCGLEG